MGLRPGKRPLEGGEGVPGGPAPDGVSRHRQQGLLQVLKAYTLHRPEQGYCQAQGPVAAVLLMHLPPEVSAPGPAAGARDPDPQPQGLWTQALGSLTPRSCPSDLGPHDHQPQ